MSIFDNATKRKKAYVWVTWITGLLAGTDRCQWKAWVKANYQLPKKQEDPADKVRLNQWLEKHTAMTQARASKMLAEGLVIRVEEENSFKIEGQTAIIAGKPDLIGLHPEVMEALIVDQKSGREKEQYVWQVILYMWAMSLTHLKGYTIKGEIEYADKSVNIRAEALNNENKERIKRMMQIMGQSEPPAAVPSASECQYCDVIDCPVRYQTTANVDGF